MVEQLLKEERRVGKRKKCVEMFARLVGVSERSIRNWRTQYLNGVEVKVGRPLRSLSMRLKLVKLVKDEWEKQGRPGWRPVCEKLKGHPVDLIQNYIAQLKRKERAVVWRYKRIESRRTEVLYKDIVWTQDATYLKENKKRAYAEVLKDRCTLEILEAKQVSGLTTENVENILEKKELPLVYMTDNGSAYCSKKIALLLKNRKVIHLKSLPATPEHNGGSEIAVREIKRQVEILKDSGLSLSEALSRAKGILNTKKLWRKHGYITAHEKSLTASLSNKEVLRDKIYSEYEKGLVKLNKASLGKRKRRLEERELIFSLLEKHKLIKRYRGSQNFAA